MKTTFTITEKNFDVELLKSFAPVSGNFDCDATRAELEDVTPNHIEAELANQIKAQFGVAVDVQIFHSNGHAINSETPTGGTFLATRSSRR